MALSMSSAGAGGAGGGGGMSMAAMAHHPGAGANAVATAPPPGPKINPGASTSAGAPPPIPSAAALAADQIGDKRLARVARSTMHMPLLAVDLFGGGHVSYNPAPPLEEEGSTNASTSKTEFLLPMGQVGCDVVLTSDEDAPYKALRKLLSKGYGYESVLTAHPICSFDLVDAKDASTATNGTTEATILHRPHAILGARRTKELDPTVSSQYHTELEDDAQATKTQRAISEAQPARGVTLHDQALDGSPPNGDDYDRVSFHVPLHNAKKPLTLLPEEAVSILLAQAKRKVHVHRLTKKAQAAAKAASSNKKKNKSATATATDVSEAPILEDDYMGYPVTIPIPGFASSDAIIESLLECCGGEADADDPAITEHLLFPRSLCALVASFRSLPNRNIRPGNKGIASSPIIPSKALRLVGANQSWLMKRARGAASHHDDDDAHMEGSHVEPLVLTASISEKEGSYEICAYQVVGNMDSNCPEAPYSKFRSLHSRCGRANVVTKVDGKEVDMQQEGGDVWEQYRLAFRALRSDLEVTLPGRDIAAVVVYSEDTKLQQKLEKFTLADWKNQLKEEAEAEGHELTAEEEEEFDIPAVVTTREDAPAVGAAMLAAAATYRAPDYIYQPMKLQPTATCAVGMRIGFHGPTSASKHDGSDEGVKMVFDFDRRLPAGPYDVEFSAAEAAFARDHEGRLPEEESEIKLYRGRKFIEKREEAAKNLRVQMVQKCSRTGKWVNVGEVLRPLCMIKKKDGEEEDGKEEIVGCESSNLGVSLSAAGVISTQLVGDGESVVQANKSKRTSAIQYWVILGACILFFGGLLIKSFWEDVTFKRDTKRLLAYYKHVIPGSLHDGDERGARWLVYKYRNKKEKLWRRLEKKYGVPVPHSWPEDEEEGDGEEEGEKIDLDEEKEKKGESDTESEGGSKEEAEDDSEDDSADEDEL